MKHLNGAAVFVAVFALATAGAVGVSLAQPTSSSPLAPRPNGPRSNAPTEVVLLNATVHARPGEVIERGAVEIDSGRVRRVVDVSSGGYEPPAGYAVRDLGGMHVYPAFIDAFVEVDAEPARPNDAAGAHWNDWVTPDRMASSAAPISGSARRSLRGDGFGAAMIVPRGGVFAGMTAVVSLASDPEEASGAHETIYRDRVAHAMDFQTAGWGDLRYPSSHPGAVALMRQTFIDAAWQSEHKGDTLSTLDVLTDHDEAPLLVDTEHELEVLLAADVAAEAGRGLIVVGCGTEFRRLDAVAGTGSAMIVPLRFPRKPDLRSPGAAEAIDLGTLMTWEHAPGNAGRLHNAGVTVAITRAKSGSRGDFMSRLREAIDAGLTEEDALAMLTTNPASILGVVGELGTVTQGARANVIVVSGPVFGEGSRIVEMYIDGRRHLVGTERDAGLDGVWVIRTGEDGARALGIVGQAAATIEVSTADERGRAGVRARLGDDINGATSATAQRSRVSFVIDVGGRKVPMSAEYQQERDELIGTGLTPGGVVFPWSARRGETADLDGPDADGEEGGDNNEDIAHPEKGVGKAAGEAPLPELPGYPFGPYAVASYPEQETLLFTNATVWTQSERGTIESGWVLVRDGRISAVGAGDHPRLPEKTITIDAAGKHITPGLIDAHSHSGLFRFGVNEAGQAVTAEVRIGDALDPGHISFYRQLAGGVTTVLSLHGSANPIGGQSQIHKVRWGAPDTATMRFRGSKPGIKFALGENVKQSNWEIPAGRRTRYPQSRMGVETIMRDRLSAALEYEEARRTGRMPDGSAWRRDLELDAIGEILRDERLVHCHSYRQDEILMLCRIAGDYGFTIGTFQHGLEVYKVAEAVQEHAIGASLFSDWWMFKMEVMDAIPFAGPLQSEAGVLTSYNSDSDELSRRMNLEAAKVLKYARRGDDGEPVFTPEQALAFVTINPAIQLGIGDRVGSLEAGKDADLVIWSADPLSTRAVVERVVIDGRTFFTLESDRAHRERIAAERARLIQKVLGAQDRPRDEGPADPGNMSEDERRLAAWYRTQLKAGLDPEAAVEGDCGCSVIFHKLHGLHEAEH